VWQVLLLNKTEFLRICFDTLSDGEKKIITMIINADVNFTSTSSEEARRKIVEDLLKEDK